MIDIALGINKEKFLEWLKLAELTQTQFAHEIGVDEGNFSKMLDKIIPTPKHVIEKVLGRTLLPHGAILESYQNGVTREP